MITIENLSKSFGARTLWSKVDFTVRRGEMLALTGPSGAGKSTLLNCLGLLNPADGGRILFEGQDITRFGVTKRRRFRRDHLGYLFQDYALIENATITSWGYQICGVYEKYEKVYELLIRGGGKPEPAHRAAVNEVSRLVGSPVSSDFSSLLRGIHESPKLKEQAHMVCAIPDLVVSARLREAADIPTMKQWDGRVGYNPAEIDMRGLNALTGSFFSVIGYAIGILLYPNDRKKQVELMEIAETAGEIPGVFSGVLEARDSARAKLQSNPPDRSPHHGSVENVPLIVPKPDPERPPVIIWEGRIARSSSPEGGVSPTPQELKEATEVMRKIEEIVESAFDSLGIRDLIPSDARKPTEEPKSPVAAPPPDAAPPAPRPGPDKGARLPSDQSGDVGDSTGHGASQEYASGHGQTSSQPVEQEEGAYQQQQQPLGPRLDAGHRRAGRCRPL